MSPAQCDLRLAHLSRPNHLIILTQSLFGQFYNNNIVPASNELNQIAKDLTLLGAEMSAVGAAMLLTPVTAPLGTELLLEEPPLLAAGSSQGLGGFKSTPPLTDPPLNLPTATPGGALTPSMATKFQILITNQVNLVQAISNLKALIQNALANPALADSLIPQITTAAAAISKASADQSLLFASLLSDLQSGNDVQLTNADFLSFLASLKANGFPVDEVDLFHQMGFSDAQIADLLANLLAQLNGTTTAPSLFSLFDEASQIQANFAQVTNFAAAVPEPSTWAMMLIGFVGFVVRRRKCGISGTGAGPVVKAGVEIGQS